MVKPEIIKARLKALFPKANLSQKRLDAIAAKLAPMPSDDADDAAVDLILNQANDFNAFEEIAREDDRIRTLEEKAAKVIVTPPSLDPPTPPAADVPEWAKAMVDANKTLLEKVTALESGKVTEDKRKTAQTVFETSEVLKAMKPEIKQSWLGRINVDSEITIEDQVKNLETEYSDIRQSVADTTRFSGPAPIGTGGNNKPSADEVKSIVDNML